MTRVQHRESRPVRPLCAHFVTRALDGEADDIEAGPDVAHASGGEGGHRGRGHAPASRRMSLRTPAAVTSGARAGPGDDERIGRDIAR